MKLIENQQDKLSSIIDNQKLEKDDVLSLLKSLRITKKTKNELIKRIDCDFIAEHNDVAKLISDILVDSEHISLNYEVLNIIIPAASSCENKINILNKQGEELTDSQLQSLIELLGDNYQKLFIKKNKPTFLNTVYNKTLFELLEKRKLIKRHEQYRDDKLKVFANY